MSGFTVKPLTWQPYITPVDVDSASAEQRQAMRVTPSNTKISPYVRTLAHDPESYSARTRLYNLVMYAEGGLPHQYRELGALVASVVNGCVYCASVHARRHIDLAGHSDVVRELYTQGLSGDLDARSRAVADFCRALSAVPPAPTADQVAELRAQGFSNADIIDLIHAAAMFGWANRLMHTLGHAEPAAAG